MAVLLTPPVLQFFDNDGNPLAGGKLYTYVAGTVSTPKATFTDESGATPATNPIILDSAGRATVWINGAYKFVLKDALDNTIFTKLWLMLQLSLTNATLALVIITTIIGATILVNAHSALSQCCIFSLRITQPHLGIGL